MAAKMRWFPRPTVLTVAVLLLLLPSRPSRGRPIGVRRGADSDSDEEEEHRKMSKAMVRQLKSVVLTHSKSSKYLLLY